MYKKLFALALCVCLVLSLAGCGAGQQNAQEDTGKLQRRCFPSMTLPGRWLVIWRM